MLSFWQRLSVSKRISFLAIILLLVSIPAGIYLAQKTQIFRPKAASSPVDFYGTQVSFLKLFGQKSIGETSPGKVTANGTFHTSGVVVDRSSTPNKVYVVDTGNNRILGFNGIDGDGTKPADMVFGQPSFTTGLCNGDNNLGINKSPTASTLCLIGYPYITNLGEYWMRANFDVDGQGNLYVIDVWNNRVLKYNQPLSSDKSDGKGDNVADFVWGQPDFNSNGINQGNSAYYDYSTTPKPNASSLWTSFGFGTTDHVAARGVSVDQQGNIWVADSFNHRILRFPPNSKEADLVLGQSDFTSNTSGCQGGSAGSTINAPLNMMCTPTLARVDPETGQLYVLDEHPPGFRARILVFNSEFRNGVTAGRVIVPEGSVTGFIFNTFKTGDYANGKLWVNEHGLSRTVLIDDYGTIIKVIGTRGKDYIGGEHTIPSVCGANSDFAKKNLWTGGGILDLWTPGGSIGFDSENNIYLAEDITDRVMRYALPYEPRTVNGTICLPEPNGGLFPVKGPGTLGPNIKSDDALSGGIGVAVFGNQLIIENAGFRVWNNYLDKEIGSAPDIIVPSAGSSRKLMSDAIDDSNRLWVFDANGKITVYQLPFETGSENRPLANSVKLYWEDTREEIQYNGIDNAIAFDKFNRKLYIVDVSSHRILRVSNYNVLFDSDPNNDKLLVDEVLGQIDKSTTGCNFYQKGAHFASGVIGPITADSLCKPHQVKFDKLGNLYVVENDYECQGNDRITLFTAEDLKNAQGLFPRLQAKKVFVGNLTGPGPCAYGTVGQPGSPVAIAFDSRNQMVVGNDGYYGTKEDRHLKQLWLYSDPLTRQTPDAYINLPMGASGELAFDTQDNLIVQDHTWSKVWIINLDRDPSWVKWLRTVPIPSPVPSPSPYPSPSPTSTPTPTPALTPVPSPTPTLTPAPTGNITTDPNPCSISYRDITCPVNITYTYSNVDSSKAVTLCSSWNNLSVSKGASGTTYATSLSSGNYTFKLVTPSWDCQYGTILDSKTIVVNPVSTPIVSPTPTIIPTPTPIPSPSPTSYSQSINYGWTMVGLPVDKTGDYRAEDFLREINGSIPTSGSSPNAAIKIYKYDTQNKNWQSHNLGSSENNFSIFPGEGYFVLSKVSGNASILGFRRTTTIPIVISNGWSLISVYTNRPGLTGDSLLREMRNQGIDARYLARWNGTDYEIVRYTDTNTFTVAPEGAFWIYNDGNTQTFQSTP